MDIEEFLEELKILEQQEQILPKDKFQFGIMAMGSTDVRLDHQLCEPTNLPIGLGPFGTKDVKEEIKELFLQPKQLSKELLTQSQRILEREIDLDSLMMMPNSSKLQHRIKVKRNVLDGNLDLSSYEQVEFVND
jgi:hypothetical protein